MGLEQMFDSSNADFSQMAEFKGGNIYVGAVLHKTYIEMAEKGTKAAAVTAEIMCGNALPPEDIKEVYLDRPFVYVIMDNETNMPIFVGTVLDFE
jgi:serpin B